MRFSTIAIALSIVLLGAGCIPTSSSVAPSSTDQLTGDTAAVGISIDLSGQGLTQAPEDIFMRSDVTSLDLSDNALEGALPAEIRHMRSLEVLDVSGNRMTGVPAEIGQLRDLRILDLSDNQLTGLPYELGNLQNLEVLDVSGNDYSEEDLTRIEGDLRDTTVIRR